MMHRRSASVLSALALLALLLAACTAGPSPTASPAPTATPSPLPTSSPTPTLEPTPTPVPTSTPVPTPTPVPRYTLKKSVLPYLGIGTFRSYVMGLAGHFTGDDGRSDTVFRLEGGGYVVLTFKPSYVFGSSVDTITIDDADGTRTRAIPNRSEDFDVLYGQLGIAKGALSMTVRGEVKASEIKAALGEPLSDVSSERTEYEMHYMDRRMTYDGFEIWLYRFFDAEDKDAYRVESLKTTRTDLVSPCGWRIGMTAAEAVAAAEPYDWFLLPKLGADGKLATLEIVIQDLYGYGRNAVFAFDDDIATSMYFTDVSVGA